MEDEDAQVGESTVRNLAGGLQADIGANRCQVNVPQTHPPAAEAEVDFGEFTASIAGQVMKLYMLYAVVAFGEGSISAISTKPKNRSWMAMRARSGLGGVPTGMIRDDNLKPAMTRIALGRERVEHPRSVAMRSHYGPRLLFASPA